MKNLTDCFVDQADFTDDFIQTILNKPIKDLTTAEMIGMIRHYVLSLHREVSEVLDTADWKVHVINAGKIDYPALQEELIDVQKFIWGLMHICGMRPQDLVDMYTMKSSVVRKKFSDFKALRNG